MIRCFDQTQPEAPLGPLDAAAVYRDLHLPRGLDNPRRPYILTNMVTTVDGKAVIGGPRTSWTIGSQTDHLLFRQIEAQCDALLLGAGVVREDDPLYPRLDAAAYAARQAAG